MWSCLPNQQGITPYANMLIGFNAALISFVWGFQVYLMIFKLDYLSNGIDLSVEVGLFSGKNFFAGEKLHRS